MGQPTRIVLQLGGVLLAGGLLSGCVAQVAHAVFSPALDSFSHSMQTPESVGITTSTWRGKSCEELASSYDYMTDTQRKTAASGDAHMAKVHGWQVDAIQQVRREQGCLGGTVAQAPQVAAPVVAAAPLQPVAPTAAVANPLGLKLEAPSPELVKALGLESGEGAWVVDVAAGSAAADAGIKPMDVILDVSGQVISRPGDVQAITGKMRAGYKSSVTVWRNRASREVALVVPAGMSAPVQPVRATAPVQEQPAAVSADARYCSAVVATQHTYGSTVSPVKLIPGAAKDIQSVLRSYIAKVKQAQPGLWGELTVNTLVCQPGAVVCSAEGKGPGGKTQNAFAFCHATQAQADREVAEMRKGDPQAVVVDWP
ncbi:PDZ domain-containing protein [Pseudomonas wadenswilerensis]